MDKVMALRLSCIAGLALGCMVVGSATHASAFAAEEFQQYLAPLVMATCASTSPCQTDTNSKSGAGIEGISSAGNGSIGQTKFKSTNQKNGVAGVLGQDKSASGPFDSGVKGTSTIGTGVMGISTSGIGLYGITTNGVGVSGASTNNDGVDGLSISGLGGYFSGGIDGLEAVGPVGVTAVSHSSTGDAIQSYSGGGLIFDGFDSANTSVFAVDGNGNLSGQNVLLTGDLIANSGIDSFATSGNTAVYGATKNGGYTFEGNNIDTGVITIFADSAGNLNLDGLLYTAGSCNVGCAKKSDEPGVHEVSYAPRESQPTIEDFGDGQLTNGSSYVRIDPAFANSMDQTSKYMVFITPEGDSNGVYVTDKSVTGFAVRENKGGRSTLAFSYRIVAKPYGVTAARLPMVDMRADHSRIAPRLQGARVHVNPPPPPPYPQIHG